MPSGQRVFLPAHDGDWNEIDDEDANEEAAQRYSATSGTMVIYFSMSTSVDLVWIKVYDHGQVVRELLHTEDGWEIEGAPLPFENAARLAVLLGRPPHDGYDVLDAFLGRGGPPPQEDIVDRNATQGVYVSGEIADELRALIAEHGWSAGQIVAAAWETTKAELHRLPGVGVVGDAPADPLPSPPERETGPIRRGTQQAPKLPAKSTREKVMVRLALPGPMLEEMQRLAMHLDRGVSWVVVEAYRRARPLVAG